MSFLKLNFKLEQTEILLAFLQMLPFDSFEEHPNALDAYIAEKDFTEAIKSEIETLKQRFTFEYQVENLPNKNWNEVWEANFQAIIIDDFCGIRADFHPPNSSVQHEIVINPKMAFGTGHHETTFMMVQAMRNLSFADAEVFDYGCGTGILAILAAQLGAKAVDALDIEEAAIENCLENLDRNGINQVKPYLGTLEKHHQKSYDIILANINRNVILESLPSLYQQLKKNGTLLVSGFIKKDANLLAESAKSCGFATLDEWYRNNWVCMSFSIKAKL